MTLPSFSQIVDVVARSTCAPLLMLLVLQGAASAEENYTLNAQDKVRISVIEWLPTSGDFRSPITGEFIVGPTGYLSLPLIGEVHARGSTPASLAEEISERLGAKLGLEGKPKTSVEVVQFGPFYVVGHVERPGEYAYRPGLTILQAVSLAGGLQAFAKDNLLQLSREADVARADSAAIALSIDEHVARVARLEAELKRAEEIDFPSDLRERENEPGVLRIIELEQMLFEARRYLFESNLESQRKLLELLKHELQSQRERLASLRSEREAVESQLQTMQNMEMKGLAARGRTLDLARAVSEISGKIRDLDEQGLRVQQEYLQVEEAISSAAIKRRHELSEELISTKTKLNELRRQQQTSERLIEIADEAKRRANGDDVSFTIVRFGGDAQHPITSVSEDTRLSPGDVLKVHNGGGASPVAHFRIDTVSEARIGPAVRY